MSNIEIITEAAAIKADYVGKKLVKIWAALLIWLLVPYYLIKGLLWKAR